MPKINGVCVKLTQDLDHQFHPGWANSNWSKLASASNAVTDHERAVRGSIK